jgi:hypothetical protein
VEEFFQVKITRGRSEMGIQVIGFLTFTYEFEVIYRYVGTQVKRFYAPGFKQVTDVQQPKFVVFAFR